MSLTARIDKEIIRQKLVLSDLYIQRNSLAFISRLPVETMETIFIHCARDGHYKRLPVHRGHPVPPSWVNVSYVCRQWRYVALNSPALWTYHFLVSPRWTEELLARSKRASLKIRLGKVADPWLLDLVEKAMNHVERIEELSLDLPGTSARQVLPKLSSPALRLQNLEIRAKGDNTPEWSSVPFGGDTPVLRTLELKYSLVQWYSLKLSGLTTLRLVHIPDQCRQNMEDFVATLSCMQDLTCLYLYHALASATGFLSSAALHTFQKINLPHLSRLLIRSPLSTMIAFLSCVNFPLKTKVRLNCEFEVHSSLDDYALLSSVLAQRFSMFEDQSLSSPTIRSVVMACDHRAVSLGLSTSERGCDPCPSFWACDSVPLSICVLFGEVMMTNHGDHIISDICCFLPWTNVQTVDVTEPPLSPAFWRRVLGHLRNLRYIDLGKGYMPDLSVLSRDGLTAHEGAEHQGGHASGDRERDHILVPALEELELYQMTFSPGGDFNLPRPAITLHRLLDALSTRNNSQGRLKITRCKIGGSAEVLDMVQPWSDVGIPLVGDSYDD